MIKIICNRCGAEIDPKNIGYVSLKFLQLGGPFLTKNQLEGSDFCPACMDAVKDFLERPVPEQRQEDKDPALQEAGKTARGGVKPAAGKRRTIDYGKIMALHNAGWNNAKIADEMGMSKASVATALCMYRKRQQAETGSV